MLRGDVFLAELSPTQGSEQTGRRPVVVVSRNAINVNSPVVVVVPITGRENKIRIYASQVVLKAGEGGLSKDSVALGEQVRAISKKRLLNPLGHLPAQRIVEIGEALKIALDLP
jgi:mRNA interferase MazF